ncbi:50S ribosomal protein L6 [Candidatus Malacoplasma girerdii]|uniref:50S ribosomal protein L6 n=1 Tax=Candidatus Malacoplasma girerdii TaxID=1318617 RepID=A0A097SSA0_9BACT|nr:50S ribosomal protein L6 [Candidatus Malacoplasma girerdii]ASJ88995.1 MAG: 50S ribosomal protein L6 [Candidatus Malacoplasma girerdii]
MSRKGNKLLNLPQGTSVSIANHVVAVTGPKGSLKVKYPAGINVELVNNHVKVSRTNNEKMNRIFHGTINSLIHNAIIGVSEGYSVRLHIEGVGYKAKISGNKLELAIGFSHPVILDIPHGVAVACKTPVDLEITGIDKIVVGEFAANVRAIRRPEPYNGKGIMYVGEHIIRKVGKTAEGAKK